MKKDLEIIYSQLIHIWTLPENGDLCEALSIAALEYHGIDIQDDAVRGLSELFNCMADPTFEEFKTWLNMSLMPPNFNLLTLKKSNKI